VESPATTKPALQAPLPKPDADKSKPDNNPSSQQDAKQRKNANDPKSDAQQTADAANRLNQVNPAASSGQSSAPSNAAPAESSVADSVDTDKLSQDAAHGTAKIVSAGDGSSDNAAASDSSDAAASGGSDTASASGAAASAVAQPAAVVADVNSNSGSSGGLALADATDAGAIGALSPGKTAAPLAGKAAVAAAPSPQAAFVQENQPKIISSIQGQLLPNGGTMQIRLDPPELGALQVTVNMRNGVMSASFETSSDHATKLLSHSLGQLKSGLEATGVTVEKLQVAQAPKQDAPSDSDSESDSKQAPQEQQQQAQQDQQRREMVQRMWRKLAGGDPLDLVA
jgi:flagellar hook-length control protein FliK